MKLKFPRIVFFGTPEFAIPSLRALVERGFPVELVVTRPDRKKGRGRKLSAPPVKEVARELELECYQPESLKNPEAVKEIQKRKPDCMVVVAYGQIIPKELIEISPLGAINVHPSLLPGYRGAAPIQRAIMAGETETGVTIMLLDEGMDSGPILLQRKIPIRQTDTLGTLHDKLSELGADLLADAVEKYSDGKIKPVPQDHEKATFAPAITREECLVDWSRSARSLANLIRAIDPIPGAYTLWERKIMKMFSPGVEEIDLDGKPGQVIEAAPHGLLVATGDGKGLRIGEVQLAGQRRMKFSEFARGKGRKLLPGTLLGE